jgi:hypothetical protein
MRVRRCSAGSAASIFAVNGRLPSGGGADARGGWRLVRGVFATILRATM